MTQQKKIFVRTDRCVGCQSCTMACAVAHSRSKSLFGAVFETPRPKSRIYVEWVAPDNKVPLVCRHCEDAPCMHACISGAISKDENGVVKTDEDKCIGCWTCVMVCPFGVIGRHLETGKAYRCDQCPDRDIPACVDACPTDALVYETVDIYAGARRKYAADELVTGQEEPSS
ncbi:MAG: 4Fe-4S dicluster domain-containing protein [Thermodesulfobacteriota bacterium]|nr:4Fe-4S dicluster domain-containing protein [Thermodesulfobacteriota bacterium]